MPKSVTLVFALAFITFNVLIVVDSMPIWCANPAGAGNFLIQPLCAK